MAAEMSDEDREKEIARLTGILERQRSAIFIGRSIYKWILDFVRNCMVVATLFYLARRSGDWWIYGIAFMAGFALIAYCHSYVENVWFDLKIPYSGWRGRATVMAGAALVQLALIGFTVGMYVTLDRIVTIQLGITKGP